MLSMYHLNLTFKCGFFVQFVVSFM